MFDLKKETVIVTGASGMLGQALMELFPKDMQVLWISKNQKVLINEENSLWKNIQIDLSNATNLFEILNKLNISTIIHCAACTKIDLCENNFTHALESNLCATKNILEYCKSKKISPKFIYISSDAVYKESQLGKVNNEEDYPKPSNIYGLTKLWSEQLIESMSSNYLILRTTIVGLAKGHFIDWIRTSALEKKKITLYNNVIFSPVSVYNLAKFIISNLNTERIGTYNYSSSNSCSKADFAILLINKLNLTLDYEIIDVESSESLIKRNLNMVMSSKKLEQDFNFLMPTIEQTLNDIIYNLKIYQNNLTNSRKI